jgi:DNA adenine methylase
LNEPAALCWRIGSARLSVPEWRRQRAVQERAHQVSLLELGFSTFYLNRTSRSGIICSGGIIGGCKQAGKWKLDARFYRDGLIRRIEAIADYRDRISLYNGDARDVLQLLLPVLPAKSLLYLDPPYYAKARRRLYANSYEHKDHVRVATLLATTKRPWLVSYDDVGEIRRLYSRFRHRTYRLPYTAARRYEGSEIIFFSDDLALPAASDPIIPGEQTCRRRHVDLAVRGA